MNIHIKYRESECGIMLFKGVGTAIITPFKDGKINYEKFEELLEYQISNKADAIIVCGTTGESSTLVDSEKKELIKFCVTKVNKRLPVIAGTGSNSTSYSIELSKYAEDAGVDGLLVVTPYYNKATQNGLIEHYKAISAAVSTPILIYNVPSRTGLNILPETIIALANDNNICGIKESCGNMSQVIKLNSLLKKENITDFYIYSGNDDETLPILSLGGMGVISVFSNIAPKIMHDMVFDFFDKKLEKARDIQLKYYELMRKLFIEVNPIPIKTAMNLMGLDVGNCRMPLCEMEEANKKILLEEMKELELL